MSSDVLVAARTAANTDQDLIVVLADLGRVETRPERGGEYLLDHDFDAVGTSDRIAQAFAAPDQMVGVGLIDDVVVGYSLTRWIERGTVRVGHIDELFVHPDARSVGVAAAMLELSIEWARANSCEAIESQVLPGNRSAKNFFERVGMVTRQMRVSTRLTD